MSEVALSAAMRANLLTLQSTQRNMDGIQFNLATGRKVNSALDNPQAFFAAQNLSNRAADLGRLLDGMGQSISTIQQADKGAAALTKMVQQADAIANQALTAASDQVAKLTGDTTLSATQVLTDLEGVAATDDLTLSVTDANGAAVTITDGSTNGASLDVAIADGNTVEQLLADINAITVDSSGAQAFQARLDENGQLEIQSLTGGDLRVVFASNAGSGADDLNLAAALGFGSSAAVLPDGVASGEEVAITALSKPALISTSFRVSGGDIAQASTLMTSVENSAGTALLTGAGAATLQLSVNGGTAIDLVSFTGGNSTDTIQHMVDRINKGALSGMVQATFDTDTGEFSIRAVSGDVQTLEIVADDGLNSNLGFGTGAINAAAGETNTQRFVMGAASGELANLERDFNAIRTQIDQLITDTGYQGVNLLNGDNLTTAFNADRTSSITTRGVVFNSAGLGIGEANFGTGAAVNSALGDIREALTTVRRFGSSLANDLSVIQTRQDFTETTINTLTEGADKLTLADQNEEGAKMLALQTRQQLGVVSLSLASQAQQSVLRLF